MANATAAVARYVVAPGDNKRYLGLKDTVTTYYPGAMIGRYSTGYAGKMDDTAAMAFEGINCESGRKEIVTADTDGSVTILVERPDLFSMYIASAAITDLGKVVYASYDNEVSFTPGDYANVVGTVYAYESATQVLIAPPWSPYYGLRTGMTQTISYVYNAPADTIFWIAPRACRVKSITVRPRVVGSDASAVTLAVKKAASGTAPASGTALHSSTADLKGTADTDQALTLTATLADLNLAAGTALCADVTGTTTAATGVVAVVVEFPI